MVEIMHGFYSLPFLYSVFWNSNDEAEFDIVPSKELLEEFDNDEEACYDSCVEFLMNQEDE